jgi:PIN domain nuclease of toxin-antitoxin system
MRLLLETHVFLWYITADSRLPAAFHTAMVAQALQHGMTVVTVDSQIAVYPVAQLSAA